MKYQVFVAMPTFFGIAAKWRPFLNNFSCLGADFPHVQNVQSVWTDFTYHSKKFSKNPL